MKEMKDRTKTAAFCTMGCKVNSYETEGMKELLEEDGYTIVEFSAAQEIPADVYIINTCTVTQIAAKKSRQMIHRARNLNAKALVIAAGCYVDRDDSLIREGVIDLAIPNRRKAEIVAYIHAYEQGLTEPEDRSLIPPETEGESLLGLRETTSKDLQIHSSEGRTRAFLKIQDGCRQYCSYCIIPFVRGPLKSRPIEECVEEAKRLVEAGFQEIVLTGIHVSSYGRDWQEKQSGNRFDAADLGDLLIALNHISGLKRIRLSSLEPRLITPAFIQKIGQVSKLCPHFHLSLQSGSKSVLKAMNRKYTKEEYREAVRLLREALPTVSITTDVIVGFPGETEEEHLESMAFVREIGFTECHVFRYSPMEGTVAARRTDQIDGSIKKRRSDEMLKVTKECTMAFMQKMQNQRLSILLEEQDSDGLWLGYTENYLRTAVADFPGALSGQVIPVMIKGQAEKHSANHDASGVETILYAQPILEKGEDNHE